MPNDTDTLNEMAIAADPAPTPVELSDDERAALQAAMDKAAAEAAEKARAELEPKLRAEREERERLAAEAEAARVAAEAEAARLAADVEAARIAEEEAARLLEEERRERVAQQTPRAVRLLRQRFQGARDEAIDHALAALEPEAYQKARAQFEAEVSALRLASLGIRSEYAGTIPGGMLTEGAAPSSLPLSKAARKGRGR